MSIAQMIHTFSITTEYEKQMENVSLHSTWKYDYSIPALSLPTNLSLMVPEKKQKKIGLYDWYWKLNVWIGTE
jgi:hypothetical protein